MKKTFSRADSANFVNIPEELRRLSQWHCWKLLNGRKLPIDALTGLAYPKGMKSDEMGTATFEQACACLARDQGLLGPGFRFKSTDPYTGIDWDRCRDSETGDIEEWARESLAEFRETYCEVSASGTGAHAINRGKIPKAVPPDNNGNPGIEMYFTGRFFAFTGQPLNGSPSIIANTQKQLDALYRQLTVNPAKESSTTDSGKKIPHGKIDNWLTSQAGVYRRRGDTPDIVEQKLLIDYRERCELPHDNEQRVREIARDVIHWEPGTQKESGPEIQVKQGEVPQATREAETVLVEHAEQLGVFQRGGELVSVIRLPEALKKSGLRRPTGTLMLHLISPARLADIFDRLIHFAKWNAKGTLVSTDCPSKVVATYLSLVGEWKLPVLTGTIAAPLMRDDGTILDARGYDKETSLYLDSEREEWLPVPSNPTRKDAQAALKVLEAPFTEFPFVEDEDRAVAIVAIVTALQRRILSACPLFGYSAPAPRSGKSLLAEAVAIIAMGREAPASACSSDKEEFRKTALAILREGHLITNLDNIEKPLKSSELCAIITQPFYSDRLLGESITLAFPTNVMWTATGNNLAFRGDLANRALLCRIDAEKERPEERQFAIKDLKAHLLQHRAELVCAALTILRAFHLAGKPELEEPLKSWGGFDEWSSSIRMPLVWAGAADPCKTRERILAEDPEKESASVALQELSKFFEEKEFTAGEAVSVACEKTKARGYLEVALHDALKSVTGGNQEIDVGRFGWWLRSWRGRFANGLTLQRMNKENVNPAKWRVAKPGV